MVTHTSLPAATTASNPTPLVTQPATPSGPSPVTHKDAASRLSNSQASGISAAAIAAFIIIIAAICLLVRWRQSVQRYMPVASPQNPRYRQIYYHTPTTYAPVQQQEYGHPSESLAQALEPLEPLHSARDSAVRPSSAPAQCHPAGESVVRPSLRSQPASAPRYPVGESVVRPSHCSQPALATYYPARDSEIQASSRSQLASASAWRVSASDPFDIGPSIGRPVSQVSSVDESTDYPASVMEGLEETYSTLCSYYGVPMPAPETDTMASSPTASGTVHLPQSAFSSSSSGGEEIRRGDNRRATMTDQICTINRASRSARARFSR